MKHNSAKHISRFHYRSDFCRIATIVLIIIIGTIILSLTVWTAIRKTFIPKRRRKIYIGDTLHANWYRNFIKRIFPYEEIVDEDQSRAKEGDIAVICQDNKHKSNSRAFTLYIGGEPDPITDVRASLIIDTKFDGKREPDIYIPFYSLSFAENDKVSPFDLLGKRKVPKTKFCAYMYSNCDPKYEGTRIREKFYDILNERKQVDSLGKCKNKPGQNQTGRWERGYEIYMPYKFVIAFENSHIKGYITEKIVNPMLAGAIPIYFGAPDIKEHFNTKSFINAGDFDSLEDCADYVLRVDRDQQLYESILAQPWLTSSELSPHFSWLCGGPFYDEINRKIPHYARQRYGYYESISIISPYEKGKVKGNKIFINLDRSTDRLEYIDRQSRAINVGMERFPAIYGKDILESISPYIAWKSLRIPHPTNVNARPLPGEIGVYMSHITLWKQLLQSNHDYYLIIEDDVILSPHLRHLDDIVGRLPDNWDLVFLGVNKLGCPEDYIEYSTDINCKNQLFKLKRLKSQCMAGAFGYIVNKKAAMFLFTNSLPITMPIDVYIQSHISNINIYSISPALIHVGLDFDSTINGASSLEQKGAFGIKGRFTSSKNHTIQQVR